MYFIYSGFNSIAILCLCSCNATFIVVPVPANISKTVPPFGHPALIQGLINSSGKVAKCTFLEDVVVIVQTSFLLAP